MTFDDLAADRARNFPERTMGGARRYGKRTFGIPVQDGFSLAPVAPHDVTVMQQLERDTYSNEAQIAERAEDALAAAFAPRSAQYEQALNRHADAWMLWADARGIDPSNAPPPAVASYLLTLQGKLGADMIRVRVRAIAELHQRRGTPDPTNDVLVARAVETLLRGGKQRELAIVPILSEDYLRIVDGIAFKARRDLRDRVAIGLGWEGLLSTRETAIICTRHLAFTDRGITITVPGRHRRSITIDRRARFDLVGPVRSWIDSNDLGDGPLLRSVRGDALGDEELSGYGLRRILKQRAAAVGINSDHVTWHSLRDGYLVSAMVRNMDEFALAQRAGLVSTKSLADLARRYASATD